MSPSRFFPLAVALAMLPLPALAQQQSEGYKFLQAVRDSKGDEVIAALNRPGTTVINARDVTSGEAAIHIVVKRGDAVYLRFLLQKGADANLRDGKGNTPMLLAVIAGQSEMIPILAEAKANPNLGNSSGETPLIRAVQRRDLTEVRELLSIGADPDQADIIAGMSARAYAKIDNRNPAVSRELADAPKKTKAAVSGPKF